MNVITEIQRINALELEKGLVGTAASWHSQYESSAWVYAGNLPLNLTEGDVICILSQYGEIEDINLVRDDDTGKSRGFAFVKYEDSRSCTLAVDNFVGTKILGRSIRVDHCEKYRLPKHLLEKEEAVSTDPGHAYQNQELANNFSLHKGHDLFGTQAAEKPQSQTIPLENSKDEKRKRKEERARIRKERDERRQLKEERRRDKRAKQYVDKPDEADTKRKKRKHE